MFCWHIIYLLYKQTTGTIKRNVAALRSPIHESLSIYKLRRYSTGSAWNYNEYTRLFLTPFCWCSQRKLFKFCGLSVSLSESKNTECRQSYRKIGWLLIHPWLWWFKSRIYLFNNMFGINTGRQSTSSTDPPIPYACNFFTPDLF